jgi:NADPH:quinone reductase-like Zn-dependent oxidoreductase
MQRAVVVKRFGGPEVLQLQQVAVPEPKPGEARVRILAAGVAFSDIWLRKGLYPGGPKPPFTPGYDLYGQVEAVGPGIEAVREGQMVAALTVVGGYADAVVLPVERLVPVGAEFDPAEAVTLVQSYLTAYQVLHRIARAAPGERVLVHGAGGAVGQALLQLGRLAGLELYATASQPKHAVIRALGATPIDYRSDDFVARIRALTGDGVDIVCDPIGGRHLGRSLQALRAGGRVIAYGFHAGAITRRSPGQTARILLDMVRRTRFDALRAGDANQGIFAFNVTTLRDQRPDWYQSDLTALFELLERGRIVPPVAGRLELAQVAEAHRRLERADVAGKLVLLPGSNARL